MKVIPREAGRITYSTEIRNLKRLPLSDMQMAVVIGSILGDGCLCENWSKTNYRLKISHSVKQKKYLLWKYNVLKSLILSKPSLYAKTKSMTIRTISHVELSVLRSAFYKGNKKIIPKNIEMYIKNPLTITVWFMDDGNAIKSGAKVYSFHINTQSFSAEENQLIIRALKHVHGIEATIQNNKGYYRIYIPARSKFLLMNLIKPLVHTSMQYKFG